MLISSAGEGDGGGGNAIPGRTEYTAESRRTMRLAPYGGLRTWMAIRIVPGVCAYSSSMTTISISTMYMYNSPCITIF